MSVGRDNQNGQKGRHMTEANNLGKETYRATSYRRSAAPSNWLFLCVYSEVRFHNSRSIFSFVSTFHSFQSRGGGV